MATYGVLVMKAGDDPGEVAAGLMMNIPRIRAMRMMDTAQSIAIAMGADMDKVAPIMRLAGIPEDEIDKATFEQFKANKGTK